jgi:hypothetical protein
MMQTRAVTSAIVKVLDYQLPPLAEVEPDGTVNTCFPLGIAPFFSSSSPDRRAQSPPINQFPKRQGHCAGIERGICV